MEKKIIEILEKYKIEGAKKEMVTEELLILFSVSNSCKHEWIKSIAYKNAKFCNKCGKYQ